MRKSIERALEEGVYKAGLIKADEASRIGARIRFCRIMTGLSRQELGTRIDLDQNRVRQYETGRRKPKPPLLKKLAAALGVDPRVLAEPCLSTGEGVMYTLFEMELLYGLRVRRQDGRIVLSFCGDLPANLEKYLNVWERAHSAYTDERARAKSDEAARLADEGYSRWKFGFPGTVSKESLTEKVEIEKQIAALQRRLEELDKQ